MIMILPGILQVREYDKIKKMIFPGNPTSKRIPLELEYDITKESTVKEYG